MVVARMIEIPFASLAEDTLQALIESYVLREGTDYGEFEYTLEQKVAAVDKQLKVGKLKIVFDQAEETCTILSIDELANILKMSD
jgi:uncharacterized protein YheU (UPF0270 family)